MAIDRLQGSLALPGPVREPGPKKRAGGASAFDALLAAAGSGPGVSPKAQRAAAELLRLEMMQHSLALFSPGETAPAGVQALETLISTAAGAVSPWPVTGQRNSKVQDVPAGDATEAAPAEAASWGDGIGETAARFLGTPYRFGGEGGNGIDCSAFVQQVFREHQLALPRTAWEQKQAGQEVAPEDLRKGDLVFFNTYARYPSHVGIYLGDGKMIHASSVKGEVTVSDINSEYYRSRFLGARRVA